MPGDVVTVTSGKGGVGKTTTAVNLAVALRQRGHSVVVLDADLGMPNVEGFLDVDPERTLHDVLAGEAAVDDALVEMAEGLAVLAGDEALEGFAAADPAGLDGVVEVLAERYRYVLVDTGGGLSYEGVLPLELGDGIVLVTSPDPAAVGDTAKSKELADRLGVPVRGVVVTHADDGAEPEAVADRLGVDLLGTVPLEAVVAESTADGTPIAAYAPGSGAAVAYDRIAATVSNGAEPTLEPLDSRARAPDSVETDPVETDHDDGEDGEPASPEAAGEAAGTTDGGPTAPGSEVEEPTAGEEADDAAAAASSDADGAVEPDESETGTSGEGSSGFLSRLSGLFG